MMKVGNTTLFKKSDVVLGEGSVTQFIVFENKYLCSLIFYRWNTIDQVRFHTHAFTAVAFLLKGWYWEKIKFGDVEMTNFVNVPLVPRYLPKDYCHAIKASKPGTLTMVVTGPWQKTWKEYFPDTKKWVTYTWGRKKVEDEHYKKTDENGAGEGLVEIDKECRSV